MSKRGNHSRALDVAILDVELAIKRDMFDNFISRKPTFAGLKVYPYSFSFIILGRGVVSINDHEAVITKGF